MHANSKPYCDWEEGTLSFTSYFRALYYLDWLVIGTSSACLDHQAAGIHFTGGRIIVVISLLVVKFPSVYLDSIRF
jgi:hypothetical protein